MVQLNNLIINGLLEDSEANSFSIHCSQYYPTFNHEVHRNLKFVKKILNQVQVPCHEDVWWSGGIAPHILNLSMK